LDEQTHTKNADIAMLALESSLRHAIERNEFLLHYQAKRDIAGGKITGMKALLRWTWSPREVGLTPVTVIINLAHALKLNVVAVHYR